MMPVAECWAKLMVSELKTYSLHDAYFIKKKNAIFQIACLQPASHSMSTLFHSNTLYLSLIYIYIYINICICISHLNQYIQSQSVQGGN